MAYSVNSISKVFLVVVISLMLINSLFGVSHNYNVKPFLSYSIDSVNYTIPTDWLSDEWFDETGIDLIDKPILFFETTFKGMLYLSTGLVNVIVFGVNLLTKFVVG